MNEYEVKVLGHETYTVGGVTRNRAIYQLFKRYREAGYGNRFIEFKKRVVSCTLIK